MLHIVFQCIRIAPNHPEERPMTRGTALMASSDFILRGLRWLNALYALAIASLLVGTLVDEAWFFQAIGAYAEGPGAARRVLALRSIVVVGIAAAAIAHVVLTHLLAMVRTVRAGDPFIRDNARRLQAMAWWVLAVEGLHAVVVTLVRYASTPEVPLHIGDGQLVRATPLLAVLMLFVLARVFEHGTRLRDDVAGTV
jgi:hypothetical protein